jgi:hypothetical protein
MVCSRVEWRPPSMQRADATKATCTYKLRPPRHSLVSRHALLQVCRQLAGHHLLQLVIKRGTALLKGDLPGAAAAAAAASSGRAVCVCAATSDRAVV